MSGRESYEGSPMANMRLSFSADGTAIYTPMVPPNSAAPSPAPNYHPGGGGSGGGGDHSGAGVAMSQSQPGLHGSTAGGGGEIAKRKRGRPRKYAPDGSIPPAELTSSQVAPAAVQISGFQSPTTTAAVAPGATALSSGKKSRGRPPGSSNKQQLAASGSAGVGFTPHIITVKAGEDVLAKLMSFSQNNTRALCILSANGAISNVTLRQAATSGGTVTYEGRFEILSLSGSFMLSEIGGQRSRTGGLSVSLAGPDGRVLGGGVAGLLTAASPVQVIVGSFAAAGQKQSKSGQAEVLAALNLVSGTSAGGSLSESSGGPGSPLNQSNNSNPQGMAGMPWR